MSETLYHVSANPHVRDNGSTQDYVRCYHRITTRYNFGIYNSLEHLRH